LELRSQLVHDFPEVLDYAVELAGTWCNLGGLIRDQGKPAAALDLFAKAIRTLTTVLEKDDLEKDHYRLVIASRFLHSAYVGRGLTLVNLGRPAEAEQAYRQALAIWERRKDTASVVPEDAISAAGTWCNLGNAIVAQGKPADAPDCYAQAIRTLTAVLEKNAGLARARLFLRNSHWSRAHALVSLGRLRETLTDWDRIIELSNYAKVFSQDVA
jgi:tetratricopeptide (TPR) repeat protein